MAILDLRFATKAKFTTTIAYQCWPALWVFASAYSTFRAAGPPSLETIALETQLLLTHLEHQATQPVGPTDDFRTAPPHLARFLTEAAALAVTTDLGRIYGWTPGRWLLNMDDLPRTMQPLAPSGTKRPDVLFSTVYGGAVAAESRGRSYANLPVKRPFKIELDRLTELTTWATAVKKHLPTAVPVQHFMAWLWLAPAGSLVDFFDPGAPIRLRPAEEQAASDRMHARIDQAYSQASERGYPRATVADSETLIITRPVGFVSTGRFEWLSVLATNGRWPEAVRVPSTGRYRITDNEIEQLRRYADPGSEHEPSERSEQSPPIELPPLEEDWDVAVGTQLAATLISTSGYEQPPTSQIVEHVEAQIYP